MNRRRGVLKNWDASQNCGFVYAENGRIFFVRRTNFRNHPGHLRDGMTVEFSKSTNADFMRRLDEGKTRDNFVGSHRNPRPQRFGKYPPATDVVILEEGGPSHVQVTTAVEI
jgi:cold shock CspA family protein